MPQGLSQAFPGHIIIAYIEIFLVKDALNVTMPAVSGKPPLNKFMCIMATEQFTNQSLATMHRVSNCQQVYNNVSMQHV
jgi:hypothetical protein